MAKLICEQHTDKARRAILTAYYSLYGVRKVQAVYEHGQWWITNPRTGAQWSVNDAEGPGSVSGFSFECVTEGDE